MTNVGYFNATFSISFFLSYSSSISHHSSFSLQMTLTLSVWLPGCDVRGMCFVPVCTDVFALQDRHIVKNNAKHSLSPLPSGTTYTALHVCLQVGLTAMGIQKYKAFPHNAHKVLCLVVRFFVSQEKQHQQPSQHDKRPTNQTPHGSPAPTKKV